ncbi:tRNA lysidine(34) synthetase TilS [Candidatus Vidania fulgoroideae]|uniref:tRNA(Ile)-lysidine synthase n=1 Tax=Candidatus Vidania fulgoroideorum TaxID=881286 RepID=A0A975AE27_9PROT|nr:tRNA lysidine(34) synthetase TilS [Candidatus Vidania fulgoroideae]
MKINHLKKTIKGIKKKYTTKYALAFSGGKDSTMLLNILKTTNIRLIHINHNINTQSTNWENHCITIAKNNNLKITIIRTKLCKKKKKTLGTEAAARDIRYKKLSKKLKDYNITTILTAHMLEDKIETYLLNILRGCGLKGALSPQKKTHIYNLNIIRPLINITRTELKKIIQTTNINYIKDTSNAKLTYKRNIIRKILKTQFKVFFPNYIRTLTNHLSILKESKKILDATAKQTIQTTHLQLTKLKQLKKHELRNTIRYLCETHNIQLSSKNWLKEITKQLQSSTKKMLITNKNAKIYTYKNKLIIKKIEN